MPYPFPAAYFADVIFCASTSIRQQGLLIYSAIPLSAIGGIFALALRGMPFSISAGIGFIALFGVAVLNGIALIAEFNRLHKEGLNDVREIVLRANEGTFTAGVDDRIRGLFRHPADGTGSSHGAGAECNAIGDRSYRLGSSCSNVSYPRSHLLFFTSFLKRSI